MLRLRAFPSSTSAWVRRLPRGRIVGGSRIRALASSSGSGTPPEQDEHAATTTFQQLAKEARTIPNILTLTRLGSTPFLAYIIWTEHYPLAIVGCFLSGILDWFDGYLARKWDQRTVLGSFLDPLADKVFVGMLVVTLTAKGLFPWQLTTLIVGRDVLLLGGGFVYRALTKPPNVDFFATTGQGVIEVKPTTVSRINTVLQMSCVGFALTQPALGVPSPEFFNGLCWVVGGTTLASGFTYTNLAALRAKPPR